MPVRTKITSPLTKQELIEEFFNEYRNKVIEVAAFLDRLDRAKPAKNDDFRYKALLSSLKILSTSNSSRVKKILLELSDPNMKPLKSLDTKSAYGAYKPKK